MDISSQQLRYASHLLLATSLLLLSWFQIHHEQTANIDHPDERCEICLFIAHLGDGVFFSHITPSKVDDNFLAYIPCAYVAPILERRFRFALSQRGPPFSLS